MYANLNLFIFESRDIEVWLNMTELAQKFVKEALLLPRGDRAELVVRLLENLNNDNTNRSKSS